ncbi:unnamed protein product [Prunus armeniaca]
MGELDKQRLSTKTFDNHQQSHLASKIIKIGSGTTILKQLTSSAIREPSTLDSIETSIIPVPQELTPRTMKSNIQVILP